MAGLSPFHILFGILALCVVVLLSDAVLSPPRPASDPPPGSERPSVFEPSTLTTSPTPGRPGPFKVCDRTYDVTLPSGDQIVGHIFAPVLDTENCRTAARRFNLAVIAHADGVSSALQSMCDPNFEKADADWTCYSTLARHLASHAIMTVSIHRHPGSIDQTGADAIFDEILTRNLEWLYNSGESGVGDYLSDRIALIGHSAGGRSVIENAGAVAAFGKELRAVVLMSPTMGPAPTTFNGVSPALMGLHMSADSDPGAYGAHAEGAPSNSALRAYDEAGQIDDPDAFALEKTMVFVRGGTHYYQDVLFLRVYVNAFLQTHLNGHAIFRRFLKHQEFPPSLTGVVSPQNFWIMHEDPTRLAIDDFEDQNPEVNRLGGTNDFRQVQPDEGVAWQVDAFSPFITGILYAEIPPTGSDGGEVMRFGMPDVLDASGFRWLGFRIGQAYHPERNPSGENQSLSVRLVTETASQTIPMSEFGLSKPFPIIFGNGPLNPVPANPRPGVTSLNGGTKNVMRSYLVSLRDFDELDLSQVTAVELIFDGVSAQTIFVLDDLALYGH